MMKYIAIITLLLTYIGATDAWAKKPQKNKKVEKILAMWTSPQVKADMERQLAGYHSHTVQTDGPLTEIAFIDIDEDGVPEAAVRTLYKLGAIFGLGDGKGNVDPRNLNLIATDEGHGPDIKIYRESHIVALCREYSGYSHTYHMVENSHGKGTYQDIKDYGLDDAAGDCITFTTFASGPLSNQEASKTIKHEEVLMNVNLKGVGLTLNELDWQPIEKSH